MRLETDAEFEQIIDARILELDAEFRDQTGTGPGRGGDGDTGGNPAPLPLPRRQIMRIEKIARFTSGFTPAVQGRAGSAATLKFMGTPTSGNGFTVAMIEFRTADRLRPPKIDEGRNRLLMDMDIATIPHVLEQLRQRHKYIWVGWFAGDHIYADLHTQD